MNKVLVPTLCKASVDENGQAVEAKFSGHIELRKPTFDEKYRYFEECGIDAQKKNIESMSEEEKAKFTRENVASIRKMVAISIPHYVKVDLVKLADASPISSVDELMTDGDCDPIIIEVASAIISGFKVGNG